MKSITVVDARMGRGKSSAAIRYMNQCKGSKPFLYITPYLTEVDRVCELCDFEEPGCDYMSKSTQLKKLMQRRCNVASTHVLFGIMDEEALEIAKDQGYSLIIDESLDVIQGVKVPPDDKNILMEKLMSVDKDTGLVTWMDEDYKGAFSGYKELADAGMLYCYAGTMYEVMNPQRFMAFDEVYMLTYLFAGQLQRAYLDYFGFTYNIVGVEKDEEGYRFSDRPDEPPPIDYSELINIAGLEDAEYERMNGVGDARTALSANWFVQRGRTHPEVRRLRANMHSFFTRGTSNAAGRRLWTTFKENKNWMLGDRNRYASSFLPLNARATNAYRTANCVAYLVNRFVNPNIVKFFSAKGIEIDPEAFALSEMLQFIWRSAIREEQPISLYIPSGRMRELLIGWMRETSNGGYQGG